MLRQGPSRGFHHCAGVLGWPLEHSLSPVIHNAAFRALGLDWAYFAWPVEPSLIGDAIRGLRALGAAGANVTMPHKEAVIEHLDALEGDAQATGAVNTIENRGGRLIGHNTDVSGFRALLVEDIGFVASGKRAVVLGAGGAARAVVRALHEEGADVGLVARRLEIAEKVKMIADVEVHPWEDVAGAVKDGALIVNATPLGMGGENPLSGVNLNRDQTIVDLIYSPPVTPLIEQARSVGADSWGGIGMLVHQAAASFRIWTGQEPPVAIMSAAAVHALGHSHR